VLSVGAPGKALLPDRMPQGVTEIPTDCMKDANANQNKCGAWASATCVGSHGLGECCGKAGWCGTGPDYCNEGSVQANYSHGKGLCAEFGGFCKSGLTLEQLIDAWITAVANISKNDAAAMCVPAMVVAAGSSYDTDICKDRFHPTRNSGKVNGTKGLWQIRFGYSPDPVKQAETVYRVYTGNNPDNGCLSSWCQMQGCAEPHWAFGQDNNTMETHRFCRGMWTEKPHIYEAAVEKLGGLDVIRNKCSDAAKAKGLGIVGNGLRTPQTAQEQQIVDYLMQQLREIFRESAAVPLTSRIVEAMAMKGITSLEQAGEIIGKGDVSKATEICTMARVDSCAHTCLEPQLLKEWLENFLHKQAKD